MIFKLNLTIDFNFLTVFFLNFSSYLLRDHAWLYIYFIHIDRSLHSKFLNMFNLMKKWKCIYCKRKRCSVKSPTWLLIRLLSTVFWFTMMLTSFKFTQRKLFEDINFLCNKFERGLNNDIHFLAPSFRVMYTDCWICLPSCDLHICSGVVQCIFRIAIKNEW